MYFLLGRQGSTYDALRMYQRPYCDTPWVQDRIQGYLAFVCRFIFFDCLCHDLTFRVVTGWFVTITWSTLKVFVTDDPTSAPIMGTKLLVALDSGINDLGSWHFCNFICCLNTLHSAPNRQPYENLCTTLA